MTRGEALRQSGIIDRNYAMFHCGASDSAGNKSNIELIEEIFNDFESRTCKNCKLSYIDFDGGNTDTKVNDCSTTGIVTYDYKDFGCNKWQQKEML